MIMTKKRKVLEKTRYINCDFILGSAAEIERIWSISKNILNNSRKSMTPLLFESLLFLKLNKNYWDQKLVSIALDKARQQRSNGSSNYEEE